MQATFAAIPSSTRPEAASAPRPVPRRLARVCFVAPTAWPVFGRDASIPMLGGAELQQAIVARALARRGYDVSLIAMDFGQAEGGVVDGVRMHTMHAPDAGIPVLRFLHPRLTSLWSAMRRADADIYYHRTAASTVGVMTAFCRRYGKRSIFAGASEVDFVPGRQDIAFARDRWLYERGLRAADAVFAQNPHQVEDVRKHYGREALLIPNCYDPPAHARRDREGYVLWVGRVCSQKRPEIFIDIARRFPNLPFMMVGGEDPGRRGRDYASGVRAAARSLPNMQVHEFTPFEEAEKLFDGARLVVSTSPYEGFPNVFLQAWARGIPTVAFVDTGSRHRGEPVYDVVPDVEGACASIERLMLDDDAWERASARVLEHFRERHSIDSVVQLYETEFERLAATR